MAYYKITQNKSGKLQAKMQVSGKELSTGVKKTFVKRVYNDDNLTEAKFRKYVEKAALEFEEEVAQAYIDSTKVRTKVLTTSELLKEWKANIKANLSISYYIKVQETEVKFNKFLKEQGLYDKPISDIKVRDVQMFLNSFVTYKIMDIAKLKKDLPEIVKFRELAREEIINRCTSYNMRRKGSNIKKSTAVKICERYNLSFDEFYENVDTEKKYALETIKGYRRILRTLFNEAVRYEWITKNPVCSTKIGAGSNNTSLRSIPEKEVYSLKEAREFIAKLDDYNKDDIHKKVPLKMMLLTGVRNAEMCGMRWADIDFEKKLVHIHRNRLYAKEFGIYEKEPKTRTSIRDIPLPDNLIDDLRKLQEWFKLSDKDFESKLEDYHVASNVYRMPLAPMVPGVWLREYQKKWDMKHVSCHGLRHTYCSLLLSQNVPIQTVSKYMGHSDSTITLKVYSHFIPDTQDKALNALDNLLK